MFLILLYKQGSIKIIQQEREKRRIGSKQQDVTQMETGKNPRASIYTSGCLTYNIRRTVLFKKPSHGEILW